MNGVQEPVLQQGEFLKTLVAVSTLASGTHFTYGSSPTAVPASSDIRRLLAEVSSANSSSNSGILSPPGWFSPILEYLAIQLSQANQRRSTVHWQAEQEST